MSKDSIVLTIRLVRRRCWNIPPRDMQSRLTIVLSNCTSPIPKPLRHWKNSFAARDNCPLEKMQELYTITFDMQPVCYPYLGYQLFGESYKRGAFMAQLNEAYHAFGYSAVQELPDHLAIVLRFIGLDATNRQDEFCQALINDGVMPALEKMLKVFGEQSENPYFGLLSALQLFLVHTPEKELSHA